MFFDKLNVVGGCNGDEDFLRRIWLAIKSGAVIKDDKSDERCGKLTRAGFASCWQCVYIKIIIPTTRVTGFYIIWQLGVLIVTGG